MLVLYHLKGCPRCRGAVRVDQRAHPADDLTSCMMCGWVPQPRPLSMCHPRDLHVPWYLVYDPASDPELQRQIREGVLTARQRAICEMARAGILNKQIAAALGISDRTVYRWRRVCGHLDHQP
jgi:hypothetical protein